MSRGDAVFAVCSVRPGFGQDLVVDTTEPGVLIDEALNRSEVMQNLQYLTDVIGRGSRIVRRAPGERLDARAIHGYGFGGAPRALEVGGTWTRGPMRAAHDRAARARGDCGELGLGAGTGGATITGPVVRIDATTPDSFVLYRGRVKQAWG